MRIAIYARKSTESVDRQVQSLDDQLQILKAIAEREWYTVVETISEAKSAKEPGNRRGFKKLIELIETGKIDGILTWHINRLTRNLVDGGVLAHLLSSGQLKMIRTPERTFRSEDSVLLLAIENGVATSYIHDLRKAVKRGMDSKADKGWKPGQAPSGYINNWETRGIDIDPVRAPLVRKAWDMLLSEAYSVAEITELMKREGLTRKGKKVGGKPLGKTGFHNLFRNVFYTGQFLYKGNLKAGRHTPLITPSEFERAQEILSGRTPAPKRQLGIAPFAGSFTCAACGCAVVREHKFKTLADGARATYSYYHCSGAKGCKRKSIAGKTVSDAALYFASEHSVSRAFADWCASAVTNSAKNEIEHRAANVEILLGSIEVLTKRLDSLTLAYLDAEIDSTTYQRLKTQVNSELLEKQTTLASVKNIEQQIIEHIERKLEASVQASVFASGNTQYRKTVLASMGGPHTLNNGVLELRADPVIKKIVSFEPPLGSSQSVKSHDFFPDHSLWWTLADDIRNVATKIVEERLEAA